MIDYRDFDELQKSPAPELEGIDMIRLSAKREDSILKSASAEDLMTIEFYLVLPFNNSAYKELFHRLKKNKYPLFNIVQQEKIERV